MAEIDLGVIFFPAFDWAISPSHPERQERLLYTQDQFWEEGIFDLPGIMEYRPLVASSEDVQRVHFCLPDLEAVTTLSHLVSAGGAIRAAQLVMSGECRRAFALVRPPGHHAMRVVHGNRGFCNINTEAIMVEWIREHYGPKKIAIVDTDCHHGDGTQDIFWHDPDVLFISLHQDGRTIFPGTGFPYECGGPRAAGRTINVPLPPGTSDEGMLHVIEHLVLPILDDFKPDVVINSAGQDNHFSDPITNMRCSAQGYARLNELLAPDIAVLEGGYSIHDALPYTNVGIALAMAGQDYSGVREPDYYLESLRQTDKITLYIPKLCEAVAGLYFHPPTERDDWVLENGFFIRNRSIAYDTDNILEKQSEWLRECDHCPGYQIIHTASAVVPKSFCCHIPHNACPTCREEALDAADKAEKEKHFAHVRLIDRTPQREKTPTERYLLEAP